MSSTLRTTTNPSATKLPGRERRSQVLPGAFALQAVDLRPSDVASADIRGGRIVRCTMSIMPWFFQPLMPRSFRLVLIDPPWEFQTYSRAGQDKSAQAHYTVMPLDAIKVLPVRDLCQDDAVVMCWATIPMLPHALACLEAWRVIYKSNIVWRKVTRLGKLRMGCGFWTRSMHEQVLIGTVGQPPLITFPSIFDGIARQHSRKPDELYQMIADRTPGWRRADIFSRETRHGWHAWGSEAGKYDDEVRGAPIRQAGIKQRQAQKEAIGESDAPKPDCVPARNIDAFRGVRRDADSQIGTVRAFRSDFCGGAVP
jgi:N6-adenosine-specific RNA methylase IME4